MCVRASCAVCATTSTGTCRPTCSCDTPFVLKKWADEQGYNFPVLADNWPYGAVAQAYGVFNDALGCDNRATFLIDTEGVIVDVIEGENLGTVRPPVGVRGGV